MAELRLRFITEKAWISSAIRGFTNSLWSHVDIVMPDGQYLGAHIDGGVLIRPVNYCSPLRDRRYAIPVEDTALEKMLAFAQAQIGKPYDTADIAGMLFHRNWQTKDKWICSELAIAVAEAGGLFLLNVEPGYVNAVTPEMLHLSPYLVGRMYYDIQGAKQ